MKKRIVSLSMALIFALSTVGVAFAGKLKCTVDSVDGDKVTMTCKKADKLSAGDKVKIDPPKKKMTEGC